MAFTIHPTIIVRVPSLPFITPVGDADIIRLMNDPFFSEAIYLASPVLYTQMEKMKLGLINTEKEINKIKISLTKYAQRMYSRCTPFGLFAGCTTITWGNSTNYSSNIVKYKNSRLDMHYLCALAESLAKKEYIKPYLKYYANNSIYAIANEKRYIDYYYKNGKRKHSISAIANNEYIDAIIELATNGTTITTLVKHLVKQNCNEKEATHYINELIDSQFILSELEPAITGKGFLEQIIKVLNGISQFNIEIKNTITLLTSIQQKIVTLDNQQCNKIEAYKDLNSTIQQLTVEFDEAKLLQTDLYYTVDWQLSKTYQSQILEVLQLFQNHFSSTENYNLFNFKKRFIERYEGQELPILEVLDVVSGLGYTNNDAHTNAPLIGKIISKKKHTDFKEYRVTTTQKMLLKKLIAATAAKDYIIEITDTDFEKDKAINTVQPPSLACMCKLVNDNTLVVEHFSGTSAATLLGRFCNGNTNIHNTVIDITEQEQANNKNVLFAEIIHLPESRIGNVLQHPTFYMYEIPYLGKSSLPASNQIQLKNIVVSVQNDTIQLRCKVLNKLIIPRLSNAHNYSNNALPVYQFLCDLQGQKMSTGLNFYWGELQQLFTFLPRVMYKNTIISKATWNFDESICEKLKKLKYCSFLEIARAYKLPQYTVLVDGDNELLIDTSSELSVNVFLYTIKIRNSICLKEYLGSTNSNTITKELIIPLIQQTATYNNLFNTKVIATPKVELPGSCWVYYKLYCGEADGELIIKQHLAQLINELQFKDFINQWFYIRYSDPNFHIRLRFRATATSHIGNIILICKTYFQSLLTNKLVWKVQIDTYKKETERYGGTEAMGISEQLFYYDSISTLSFLNTLTNEAERIMFAMQKTIAFINLFPFTIFEKQEFVDKLKKTYAKEQQIGKCEQTIINQQYKVILNDVYNLKNENIIVFTKNSEPLIKTLVITVTNQQKLLDILTSHLHIMCNRIFITKPRLHETVLYDFLQKHFKTALHKTVAYEV